MHHVTSDCISSVTNFSVSTVCMGYPTDKYYKSFRKKIIDAICDKIFTVQIFFPLNIQHI